MMRRVWAGLALLLLAGCGNTVQTSSGAAYRAARPEFDPKMGTEIDQAVDRAANVEPLLRFPARIGLARLQYGDIGSVPPREADAWIAFAHAHPDYGSFVPVSPLVTGLAASVGSSTATAIDRIRLGAARQHVDAVLIYTASGDGHDKGSALSLLDLTIIGAYLVPSRSVSGTATASGLLVDVRNGYPYGTATATARAQDFVPSIGSGDKLAQLSEDAEVAAVGKLTTEVETMMARLRTELQDTELATLRAKEAAPPRAIARRVPAQGA